MWFLVFFAFAKLNCLLGGGGGGGYCEVWRNPRSWHTVTRPGSTRCHLQHSDSDHAVKWPFLIITITLTIVGGLTGRLNTQILCSSDRWNLYSTDPQSWNLIILQGSSNQAAVSPSRPGTKIVLDKKFIFVLKHKAAVIQMGLVPQ